LLGKSGMLASRFMHCFNERGYLCFYGDAGMYFKQDCGDLDFSCINDMSKVEVFAFGREDFDICDHVEMARVFENVKPDFVVNCAAYTNVDKAEEDEDTAMKVNGDCIGRLANLCKEFDATLIHFSTDYVFDGNSQKSWNEDDVCKPINVYGKSKLAGEIAIEKSNANHYIIRTAWLFDKVGNNFVNTMLRLADEKDELNIVSDQFGSPTYAKDLADKVIDEFISFSCEDMDCLAEKTVLEYGIYHITNGKSCSWFEFANEIFKLKEKDVKVTPVSSYEFKRAAKRPMYSVLKNNKTQPLRTWKVALRECLGL